MESNSTGRFEPVIANLTSADIDKMIKTLKHSKVEDRRPK